MSSRELPDIKYKQPDIAENNITFSSVSVALNKQKILHDVTGCAPAGEILAIMGPSVQSFLRRRCLKDFLKFGSHTLEHYIQSFLRRRRLKDFLKFGSHTLEHYSSGKTTLLNSIAGRIGLLSGEITLNGYPVDKSTRRRISYVLQQDVLFEQLTMKETIYFAAMLKLPTSMSHTNKMERIDYIIDALNIRHCLDTKVGSIMNGGLSGGEKKRANIACELITNPDILLLDEPTSGLDSYTAFQLMTQLREYATASKKVIITTIHQPSSQIFYSFDKLLLLAKGKSVYFGKAEDVLDFFDNCGLPCAPHYNPADFILEKVNGSQEDLKKIVDAVSANSSSKLSTCNNENNGVINSGFDHENIISEPNKDMSLKGDNSNGHYKTLDPELAAPPHGKDLPKGHNRVNKKWATSFWSQYRYLTLRQFKISKSQILSKLDFLECFTLSLLLGALWYQIERTDATARDVQGLIFFIYGHWGIRSILIAVSAFPSEMAVINRERASGMYRLSAYILSKFTSELPLNIVLPCVTLPITYWMAGLNPDLGRFFAFIGVAIAIVFLGQSAGFLIGATFRRIDVAMTIATLYLLTILILSGFYTKYLPKWIQYFSILYYPYRALLYLEFSDSQPIKCVMGKSSIFAECVQQWNSSSVNETLYVPSKAILELEGVRAPLYCYLLSMLLLIIVYRLLVYLAFVIVRKPK